MDAREPKRPPPDEVENFGGLTTLELPAPGQHSSKQQKAMLLYVQCNIHNIIPLLASAWPVSRPWGQWKENQSGHGLVNLRVAQPQVTVSPYHFNGAFTDTKSFHLWKLRAAHGLLMTLKSSSHTGNADHIYTAITKS